MDSRRRDHGPGVTIQRTTCQHHDFEGPLYATAVGLINRGRAIRIKGLESIDQGRQVEAGKLLAKIRIAGRQLVQSTEKGLQVEAGASHNNGPPAS